jgi:hypothetical protein
MQRPAAVQQVHYGLAEVKQDTENALRPDCEAAGNAVLAAEEAAFDAAGNAAAAAVGRGSADAAGKRAGVAAATTKVARANQEREYNRCFNIWVGKPRSKQERHKHGQECAHAEYYKVYQPAYDAAYQQAYRQAQQEAYFRVYNKARQAAYDKAFNLVWQENYVSAYQTVLRNNQIALQNEFGFTIPDTDTSYDPIDVGTISHIPVIPESKYTAYHQSGLCENSTNAFAYVLTYLIQNEKYLQAAEQLRDCIQARIDAHKRLDKFRIPRKQRIADRAAGIAIPGNTKAQKDENKRGEQQDKSHLRVRNILIQLQEIFAVAGIDKIENIYVDDTELVIRLKPNSYFRDQRRKNTTNLKFDFTQEYQPRTIVGPVGSGTQYHYVQRAGKSRRKTRKVKLSKKHKTRKQ